MSRGQEAVLHHRGMNPWAVLYLDRGQKVKRLWPAQTRISWAVLADMPPGLYACRLSWQEHVISNFMKPQAVEFFDLVCEGKLIASKFVNSNVPIFV